MVIRDMNLFVGWWHETGLALFQCAKRSSAVSALYRRTPPCRALTGSSRRHLGGLPNGRPRRYVRCTSGPLDHYSQIRSSPLDRLQRMRRPASLPQQRPDQAQCQWSKARRVADLQMHPVRPDLEPPDFRAPECSRHRRRHARGSAVQRSGLDSRRGVRSRRPQAKGAEDRRIRRAHCPQGAAARRPRRGVSGNRAVGSVSDQR